MTALLSRSKKIPSGSGRIGHSVVLPLRLKWKNECLNFHYHKMFLDFLIYSLILFKSTKAGEQSNSSSGLKNVRQCSAMFHNVFFALTMHSSSLLLNSSTFTLNFPIFLRSLIAFICPRSLYTVESTVQFYSISAYTQSSLCSDENLLSTSSPGTWRWWSTSTRLIEFAEC